MGRMACRMKPLIHILVMAVCGSQAYAGAGLTVLVKRGEGMVARTGDVSAKPIEVLVTDDSGKPAGGATVTFSLPKEGAGGRFSSGLLSESVLTASDGGASVAGIAWNDTVGEVLMQIKASRGGEVGAAVLVVSVTPGTGEIRTIAGRSGKAKWLIVAAAAGGALAGIALAGNKGSASPPSAVQPPTTVAPSLGAPSISIGKP